jgi:phosphatidylinositol alpha-1,6-mannosyltransferase
MFLKKHPGELRYDIIGSTSSDPSFVKELDVQIDRLDLGGNVRIRGPVDDEELNEAYAEADLFLLPSLHDGDYFEGFGLVFLEANAHGVPVIGPTTGGCPEAIKDGVSGYVCDPADSATIAERMEDILIHKKIKREDCIAWAKEHDVTKSAKQLLELYKA